MEKQQNSFFFEGGLGLFYEVDDEEDKQELLKFNDILTHNINNSPTVEENNDDLELNNMTSSSETDHIFKGEVNPEVKNEPFFYLEQEELNETSLTINNTDKSIEDNTTTEQQQQNSKFLGIDFLLDNKKSNKNILNFNNDLKNNITNPNQIFLIEKKPKKNNALKLVRKNDSDIIRKKIKVHYHNYIIETLNHFLKQKKKLLKSIKKHNKFLKFHPKFTTNVSIPLNKKLMKCRIFEILINIPICKKYKNVDIKNNEILVNYLFKRKDFPQINKIFNYSYSDFYDKFLSSQAFNSLINKIEKKDGENYKNIFTDVSQKFVNYFVNTKPKKKKDIEI